MLKNSIFTVKYICVLKYKSCDNMHLRKCFKYTEHLPTTFGSILMRRKRPSYSYATDRKNKKF